MFDKPDEYELRAIGRHPITQRLNRELLACFKRHGSAHLEKEANNDAPTRSPVERTG